MGILTVVILALVATEVASQGKQSIVIMGHILVSLIQHNRYFIPALIGTGYRCES